MRKLFFIASLIVLPLVLAGCQQSGPVEETRDSNDIREKEIEAYMDSIGPVLKRHADITEEGNNALLHFQRQFPRQTSATQTQLLADYMAKLEWLVPRLRADVDAIQRTTPPTEAIPIHNKLTEAYMYDHAGITEVLMYYEAVVTTGVSDIRVLDHGNSQLLKGRLATIEGMTLLRSLAAPD